MENVFQSPTMKMPILMHPSIVYHPCRHRHRPLGLFAKMNMKNVGIGHLKENVKKILVT